MKVWAKSKGFTIVELLIVIVVIGILAAITIVAYNGIQNRAKASALQSAISQASKKIDLYAVQNSDLYPTSLADAGGLADSDSVRYLYSSNNDAPQRHYCITALGADSSSYKSNISGTIKPGICPGHWDKTQGLSAGPLTAGVSYDTAVFRTSTGSIRLPPGAATSVKNGPFPGAVGETITFGFWMKTDAGWNGTASNSKIRFGSGGGGALLSACGYNGVKTSWTFITCTYTFDGSVTSVEITLRNDGSTGYIWMDDFSFYRPG